MLLFEQFYKDREFKWELGLERIKRALKSWGEKEFPSIIVAGTNGKGSTSTLIAEALYRQGISVGLFTSPHVYRFNERVKVDLKEASEEELNEAFGAVRAILELHELSYFEGLLILALEIFKRRGVECAVFEVGLGGRLDATNALNHDLAVLTSVSLDHTDYLGNSIAEIAKEKAQIFKDKSFGLSLETREEVMDAIKEAGFKGKLFLYGRDFWEEETRLERFKTSFYYKGQLPVETALVGRHYAKNCSLAIKSAQIFCEEVLKRRFFIPREFTSKLPGRFEVLKEELPVIFDGAHNPQALRTLFETARELEIRGDVVFSSFKDKLLTENLKEVKEYLSYSGGALHLIEMKEERAASLEELRRAAVGAGIDKERIKILKEEKIETKGSSPTIITGSFYLSSYMAF